MAQILGTAANDLSYNDDTDGDDEIQGLAGDDTIGASRPGADRLIGGDGADYLYAQRSQGASRATLDGGEGDDRLEINGLYIGGGQIGMSVSGGAGNDVVVIYGGGVYGAVDTGDGADTVHVGPDHGPLSLTLGLGADVIEFQANPWGNPTSPLTLTDFQPGDGGDVLKLPTVSTFLANWDESNPFAGGYLRLVQSGADTVLEIDGDATGTQHAFRELVRFANTQASAFTAVNFGGYAPQGGPTPGRVIVGSTTTGGESLSGTIGADTITGLQLNDFIRAGASDDLIAGGAGNDEVYTDAGSDTVDGGDGNDTLRGGDFDLLRGGAGNDFLIASDGMGEPVGARLEGGDGDDTFTVGLHENQRATLLGGGGRDTFYISDTGAVVADGGDGDDLFLLSNSSTRAVVTLGSGADILSTQMDAYWPPKATISDFDPGAGGDRFQLLDYLHHVNPNWDMETNPFTQGLIRLVDQGGSTVVQLSVSGQLLDSFTLENVSPSQLDGRHFEGFRPDGGPNQGLSLQGDVLADSLRGGVAGDLISGGDGADSLDGGRGDDRLGGDGGDDRLKGGIGDDTVFAGAGNDWIEETAGRNYLRGEDGNDVIIGGSGFDDINGNKGADTISGGGGGDWLLGGQGDDRINASAGGNIVNGNMGADTLAGGNGDEIVRGGQGDDVINANNGADWISGDLGSDTITGGFGGDTFHAWANSGIDRILDFRTAEGDLVQLDAGTAYSVLQDGADTVVDMGGGNQVVLVGVTATNLPPGWLIA